MAYMFSGSQKASSFVKHLKRRASFFEKLVSFMHTVVNEKASSLWKLARFLVKWSPGDQIGFFGFRILTSSQVKLWISTPNFGSTLLVCMDEAYRFWVMSLSKWPPANKIHIFQCMGKIFCVEFQRYPLKFHTKYLIHTLKDTIFIQHWNFKSS